jgi:hypothetical protein
MEWFFIEALVALAVGIAIVWWTMAPPRKLPRAGDRKARDATSGTVQPDAAKSSGPTKVD